tara:strand:- start:245 stop:1024 length:780 start_codon:yes stop_codon:yes gene_type:complete
MNKKENLVEIVPNELGAKIRVSTNNPEFAHVLLKQQKTVISPKGWVNSKTVHALLHGKVESIQDIGIAALDTLPGQIVVKESTTPFNMENPNMDLKKAGSGEDAIICCRHGEPIYRKGFYDATMLDVDEFIAHTNGEDIRNTMVEGSKEAEADFIGNMLGETPKQPDNQIDLEDSIAEVEAETKSEEPKESNPFDEEDDEDTIDKFVSYDDEDENPEYSGSNIPKNVEVEDEVIEEDNGVEVEDNVVVEVEDKDFEFNL